VPGLASGTLPPAGGAQPGLWRLSPPAAPQFRPGEGLADGFGGFGIPGINDGGNSGGRGGGTLAATVGGGGIVVFSYS